MSCHKKKLPSKLEAYKSRAHMELKNPEDLYNIYHCPEHGCYHIGHAPGLRVFYYGHRIRFDLQSLKHILSSFRITIQRTATGTKPDYQDIG